MNNDYIERIRVILISSLIVWFATYASSLRDIYMDLATHTTWALQLNRSNLGEFINNYISYPLWHIVVKVFSEVFPLNPVSTAAGVTAFFNCFAVWSVLYVWKKLSDSSLEFGNISFLTVMLFFVGPLYLPIFNESYYLGQGTGNIWHNPTSIAVKGLAVLCVYLIILIIDTTKKDSEIVSLYFTLSVLLFLSTIAKPSFIQGILPGVGIFLIYKLSTNRSKSEYKRYLFIAVAFIPSVCTVAIQFVNSFLVKGKIGEGSGIGIEFGRVLYNYTPSIGISFLLAFSFPIAVLILNFKTLIRKTSIQLAVFYELAAWLESVFLYEIGERELDGNWLWGSYLSMFIIWLVFSISYFDIINDNNTAVKVKKKNVYICMPLLFMHLLFGIGFWYSCSTFY